MTLQPCGPEPTAVCVAVSPEMTALIGSGRAGPAPVPTEAMTLAFAPDGEDAALSLDAGVALPDDDGAWRVIFLVSRSAVERLGGAGLVDAVERRFHLTAEMRAVVAALRDPPVGPPAAETWRLAKSIELLCETIRAVVAGELAPAAAEGSLSADDVRRVVGARRMIDDRWSEKLTLDAIARACGLNRAKLTRGFRELFGCSVAEALAQRRLSQASRLLLTTDLPVSAVGYEAGYLNNAAFARAFGRRFGRSPSSYRAVGMAA